MSLAMKVLATKSVWLLVPLIGLAVGMQDCTQGIASAALSLGILGLFLPPP